MYQNVYLPNLTMLLSLAVHQRRYEIIRDRLWDSEEKRLLEFQKLSTRKRKDVKAEDIKVKVHLFAFDLLYLNGEVSLPIISVSSSRGRGRGRGLTQLTLCFGFAIVSARQEPFTSS